MKSYDQYFKHLGILLAILIFFQSCTAYKSKSITLDQATEFRSKTKLETQNGVIMKFKFIENENGTYYGIKKSKGTYQKVKLNEKFLKSVKPKDKTMSTVLTIILTVGIITGLALIFQDSFKWKSAALEPLRPYFH